MTIGADDTALIKLRPESRGQQLRVVHGPKHRHDLPFQPHTPLVTRPLAIRCRTGSEREEMHDRQRLVGLSRWQESGHLAGIGKAAGATLTVIGEGSVSDDRFSDICDMLNGDH